jgi:hypothetical protein
MVLSKYKGHFKFEARYKTPEVSGIAHFQTISQDTKYSSNQKASYYFEHIVQFPHEERELSKSSVFASPDERKTNNANKHTVAAE